MFEFLSEFLSGAAQLLKSSMGWIALYPLSSLTIIGIGILIQLVSGAVQRSLIDIESVKSRMREINEWRKEQIKALRSGDRKLLAKVMKRQAYITQLQKQVTAETMKPSLIYTIPFLLLFFLLLNVFGSDPVAYFPMLHQPVPFYWWYLITAFWITPIMQRLLGLSYTSTD